MLQLNKPWQTKIMHLTPQQKSVTVCFQGWESASGRWSPYWFDDLHVPHRWVGSNTRPVWELLVSTGFTVEAVGEGAQLETVSVWEETAAMLQKKGEINHRKWNQKKSAQKQEEPVEGGGSRNLWLLFCFFSSLNILFIHCIHLRAIFTFFKLRAAYN